MSKADRRAAAAVQRSCRSGIPASSCCRRIDETGPVGMPSGFPHNPEGALAQLAAVDIDVLERRQRRTRPQVITGVGCAWRSDGGVVDRR